MTTKTPTPLPPPQVPLINPTTKQVDEAWLRWFSTLDQAVRTLCGKI